MKFPLKHFFSAATALCMVIIGAYIDMKPNSRYGYPRNANPIQIKEGFLYCDSLVLSINQIPKVVELHQVATHMMGKWNKLFTAIKIEESGHDGQASFNATAYYNLTGMRFPKKRKTTAIGKGKGYYAIYANWYEGMVDFKYYLDYMEGSFLRKHQRYPLNEVEFIQHIYGSFNVHGKWKQDVFFILRNHALLAP
jgi:hypothetical protein